MVNKCYSMHIVETKCLRFNNYERSQPFLKATLKADNGTGDCLFRIKMMQSSF